jgi:hypothetical protein
MRSSSTATGRSLGGDLTVDDMDQSADTASLDPQRYFEQAGDALGATVDNDPVCLYLETTNRCNLLCTTCPRTFEDLEPPADMSWELFTSIVDQFPKIARVVLHGIGEPMMVRELPRMIRYLKDRGTFVLFNTNGTLLTRKRGIELIESGLDELRCRWMRLSQRRSRWFAAAMCSIGSCATCSSSPRCSVSFTSTHPKCRFGSPA